MGNEIKYRSTRKIDFNKNRLNLNKDYFNAIGVTKENPLVVVTIYDNKIVITKKKGE